jgi:hypothetical protein
MAARALTTLLMMPLMVSALEQLDDTSMSDVVAQEGVRLISEYELYIQNISLIDTNDKGTTTLSDITQSTRPNRQQIIDFKIASELELHDSMYGAGEFALQYNADNGAGACAADPDACGGRLGLAFFNRDLPYDMTIGGIEINGKSVAKMSITDFEVNAFAQYAHNDAFLAPLSQDQQSLNVTAYAGGFEGRGINLSIYIPKTAQFKQDVEVNGVKFASTVRFIDADPEDTDLNTTDVNGNPNTGSAKTTIDDYQGGLDLTNITVDGVDDGIRIGLPTLNDGVIAITDFRIGNDEVGYDFINDIILKDIDLTGGFIVLKPDEKAGSSSITMDMTVNKDTALTYVYRDPNDQISTRITLTEDLVVEGARLNTSLENGLELGLGSVKGRVKMDQFTLAPNFYTDEQRAIQAPLGELTVNLNIARTSYLHIQGN